MVFVEPKQRVANQEATHFIPAVVKNKGIPVALLALPRVGVLVKMRPVEKSQARFIFREMRGSPIENDSDSMLVKIIDQIHEIRRSSEPAGRSKVTRRLISPGTIKWMFHHRKEFDVRKPRIVNVIGEQRRHFPIRQPAITFLRHAPPRTKVHLVYGDWEIERVLPRSLGHPRAILPRITL